MAKKYKGSLSLEWFNKQKAIVNLNEDSIKSENDIPAPRINWINKEEALFYELNEEEGKGNTPYWVNRDDIRVKEARPLVFQKAFKAVAKDEEFTIQEIDNEEDALDIENMLIKGDNLLALNTLKKHFDKLPDNEKVKCIYIDPPYNTGSAFDHYDDNFKHSEWLTLMRDRLTILKKTLQDSGTIFISIDNEELPYLMVLMDDIFGKENRKNIITLKRGSATGAKVINPGLVNISEFILVYSNDIENWKPNKLYSGKSRDERYSTFITNYDNTNFENWKFCSLLEAFASFHKIEKRQVKKHFGSSFEDEITNFITDNSERVIRFASLDSNSISKSARELKIKSKQDDSKVFKLERDNGKNPYYIYKGSIILFVKDRLKTIDGKLSFSEPLSDIWMDTLPNDLHNEGGVDFRKGKKPEKLLQRLIELVTDEGDTVLDIFGGSGSTFGTAHKMNRKWIGVEIGNHAETHIIPRLSAVLKGTDTSGISKSVNWQGGGSFKYYHLGESIISIDEETKKGEFNWSLGKQFIQESLLQSYDFVVQDINVFPAQIFQDEDNKPTVGKIVGSSNVAVYGLAFLATPQESNLTITNEEVKTIYSTLRNQPDFQSLVIYSNKGIDIAQDTIPEDLAIIKVPHAIFSELER
ncbi:site-specific DNA-methyltransferase [Kordia algicida OT-1]|uniref:site-specific DNA-methyltransferase (adenine-specific) n=1 Tax=Kordia algicida OT-1 TaxID=391587 RepID=A9EBU1_9FLAO|nr:site-specific DNA-methyltransferase [Kordia algicida]EDP94401.1 DNA methylase N-4/N-6 domain protein [Kordia algicida OT-1]